MSLSSGNRATQSKQPALFIANALTVRTLINRFFGEIDIFIVTAIRCRQTMPTVQALMLPRMNFQFSLFEEVILAGDGITSALAASANGLDIGQWSLSFQRICLESASLDHVIEVAKMIIDIHVVQDIAKASQSDP